MSERNDLTFWRRWLRHPQKVWLRKAFFQLHLWSGIAAGLYIFIISITGSVLVYRNELDRAATAAPVISTSTEPRLTDGQLKDAARKSYPGYRVVRIGRALDPDQAVDVWLNRGNAVQKRLFDPRSGRDLGNSVPTGIRLVASLSDLHDNLFAGPTGRKLNGVGALAILGVAFTGLAIWWPGIKTWRRSLRVPRGLGWRRWTWHLHSTIGFWGFGFLVVFSLSGIYLVIPEPFLDLADQIQPPATAPAGIRFVDQAIYWLAYLHFGRINGIGIPCSGPGLCDQATKAIWALSGLTPAAMVVTGAMMWWSRVLRPRLAGARRT